VPSQKSFSSLSSESTISPENTSPDFYRDQATTMMEASKRARFNETKQSFESVSRWYRILAEHVERFHSRA
jgi:hypothetical protein